MKVTVNVDCTPEEARAFLGLPDVAPLQSAMMEELQRRMTDAVRAMAPEAMAQAWFPLGTQSVEQWQKLFWGQGADRAKTE